MDDFLAQLQGRSEISLSDHLHASSDVAVPKRERVATRLDEVPYT